MNDMTVSVALTCTDLVVLKSCIKKEIHYVEKSDFEKEFNPLGYTKKDVMDLLDGVRIKIDNAIIMYGRVAD